MQLLEFAVLCVTLFAQIIVAWYIFRPMTERIKRDIDGHQTGDELLVNISTVLKQRLRKSDVLKRLGDDEFAVLLSHVNGEQAETIAEQADHAMYQAKEGGRNRFCLHSGDA